jgi:hypothetical protein
VAFSRVDGSRAGLKNLFEKSPRTVPPGRLLITSISVMGAVVRAYWGRQPALNCFARGSFEVAMSTFRNIRIDERPAYKMRARAAVSSPFRRVAGMNYAQSVDGMMMGSSSVRCLRSARDRRRHHRPHLPQRPLLRLTLSSRFLSPDRLLAHRSPKPVYLRPSRQPLHLRRVWLAECLAPARYSHLRLPHRSASITARRS